MEFCAEEPHLHIYIFLRPRPLFKAFHMLIGLGKDMTCIDFGFTRSKVKVTRALFEKKQNICFCSLSCEIFIT